jgi:hypothetical protein
MPSISLLPMLGVQRQLYEIPRGPARFRRYLDVMMGDSDDVLVPLSRFNPMGKEHASATLDALITIEAEAVAVRAIEDACRRLPDIEARFRVGLVLADDRGGGWTNRHYTEIDNRFRPTSALKRGWAIVLAWTSEVPTAEAVRGEVLATIYRNAFVLGHGEPKTLGGMMIQEGLAAVFSGQTAPGLDAEELAYTREVIRPHLDATDLTTILPALYGDRAARSVGNDPMGLSDRAGLELATAEALALPTSPEDALRSTHAFA